MKAVFLENYLIRNRIRVDVAENARFVENCSDFRVIDASVFAEKIFGLAPKAQANEMQRAVKKAVGGV